MTLMIADPPTSGMRLGVGFDAGRARSHDFDLRGGQLELEAGIAVQKRQDSGRVGDELELAGREQHHLVLDPHRVRGRIVERCPQR